MRRWWGLAGAIMSIFFYIYPDVGASFALIAYVTVALGGFGSVFGAFAGGIIVGLVEATTAIDPAAFAEVGWHLCGLSSGRVRAAARSVRVDVMDTDFAKRRRRDLIVAFCLAAIAAVVPLFIKDVTSRTSWC